MKHSIKAAQIKNLQRLELKALRIRDKFQMSPKGETLYQAPRSTWSNDDMVVEADGAGGAKLLIVEGNYPIDYLIHREQRFDSEEEAVEAADAMVK